MHHSDLDLQVILNESDAYFCQFKTKYTISDFMFDFYDL